MLAPGFEIEIGDLLSISLSPPCIHDRSLLCCHFYFVAKKILGLGFEIETRDSSTHLFLSLHIHEGPPPRIPKLATSPFLPPFLPPSLFRSLLPLHIFGMSRNGMIKTLIVPNQSPTFTSPGTSLADLKILPKLTHKLQLCPLPIPSATFLHEPLLLTASLFPLADHLLPTTIPYNSLDLQEVGGKYVNGKIKKCLMVGLKFQKRDGKETFP